MNDELRFAPLQSHFSQRLQEKVGISTKEDSIVVIDNNKWYTKSSAALIICKYLPKPWSYLKFLFIIPKPIRDRMYEYVAYKRTDWFGKQDACMLPTPETEKKFLVKE